MSTVLISAPYMLPTLERFRPVFEHYGMEVIAAHVNERLEETDLLACAGQFDGAICGDDRFSERVIMACLPRLKVISKWGTGIDSIDRAAAARLGVRVCNTPSAFTLPVSDSVLGYMLDFGRRLHWMDR
jgi:D-3-phosphoglycerate dehydrogenase